MPDWARHVRPRLSSLRLSPTRENEIVDELSQHLEDRWRELIAGGTSTDEATQLALADFSDGNLLAEDLAALRQAHAPAPIAPGASTRLLRGDLWRDVRYAARMLRKQRGFAISAVVTLAFGIGASTAIFSVLDPILLRGLPYPESERLVRLTGPVSQRIGDRFHTRDELRKSHAIASVGLYATGAANLAGAPTPERARAAMVGGDFFAVMSVTPLVGRPLRPSDLTSDQTDVAVISHGLWRRRFGADPAVIGRVMTVNGRPFSVLGVMPPGFTFPGRTDLWTPATVRDSLFTGAIVFQFVARLADRATISHARAELEALAHEHAPTDGGGRRQMIELAPLHAELVRSIKRMLLLAAGAVALVLLIACVNVANLLLARSLARQAELDVRAALGAGRRRLVRQLLVESLLLALLGGAFGIAGAWLSIRALEALIPPGIASLEAIALDGRVLLFGLVLSLSTVLLFGLLPAVRASRRDLRTTMWSVGETRGRGMRLSSALVVVEVALALALLIGAGLLLRSFGRVLAIDPGFDKANVLTFELSLTRPRYTGQAAYAAFYRDLRQRLLALPGVGHVGAVNDLPLAGRIAMALPFEIEGRPDWAGPERLAARYRVATPGYFEAMRIPIRLGRSFADTDSAESPRVVVVNHALARRAWGNASPLGSRLRFDYGTEKSDWFEVVGVAGNVRHGGPEQEPPPEIYLPLEQEPWPVMSVVLRSRTRPQQFTASVRSVVHAIDPDLPLYNIRSLRVLYDASLAARRFAATLVSLFGLMALVLAAVGIFGVMAYVVALRTREIAIRLALGSTPAGVPRLVLGRAIVIAGLGLGLGSALALSLSSYVRSFLYQVAPDDPITFTAVALLLFGAALLAGYFPARRASRIDPMTALRNE